MIQTNHICAMLVQAEALANSANNIDTEVLVESESKQTLINLRRAINLAQHAAAELEDEYLRAKFGERRVEPV